MVNKNFLPLIRFLLAIQSCYWLANASFANDDSSSTPSKQFLEFLAEIDDDDEVTFEWMLLQNQEDNDNFSSENTAKPVPKESTNTSTNTSIYVSPQEFLPQDNALPQDGDLQENINKEIPHDLSK